MLVRRSVDKLRKGQNFQQLGALQEGFPDQVHKQAIFEVGFGAAQ